MTKDTTGAPRVTDMKVVPVAGQDSMLLNLSGAHGPLFTRNIVILTDSAGHTGVGEVPGGEKIRKTLLSMTYQGMWKISFDERSEQIFDFDIVHLKKGGTKEVVHVEP